MALFRGTPLVIGVLVAPLCGHLAAQDVIGEFPHVQVPVENPLTPEKIRLGQALFFEEQVSSDDTMACATCHSFSAGGGDPRPLARSTGADGRFHTADDEFGSPGMKLRDARGAPLDGPFGAERQVTARNPPTVVAAAFFNTQFWDTRALPTFRDLDGNVVLLEHGSLESQAVGPMISSAEMSYQGRTWGELTTKLATSRPLALARDIPAPLAEFIGEAESYGPLFERAFGTSEVTRERIAMAIASYERTLIPDQTPFDLGTMTLAQERGYELFLEHGACEICHVSKHGLFTDGARRTISLPDHERAVKTPTLRNTGLRRRYMSSGQFSSLSQVLMHYEGLDFIHFDEPADRRAMIDFIGNALTDPRVAAGEPPFEHPTLCSETESEAPHGLEVADTYDAPAHDEGQSVALLRLAIDGELGIAQVVLTTGSPWAGVARFPGHDISRAFATLLARDAMDDGAADYRAALPLSLALPGLRGFTRGHRRDSNGLAFTAASGFALMALPAAEDSSR
jgi:cytochrome c peroxidase